MSLLSKKLFCSSETAHWDTLSTKLLLPSLFDVSSGCAKRKHKDKIFALNDFSNTWLEFCNYA